MAKKKGKSVSFDAMVKYFMTAYQIPTKRDVDRLNARLDRIEKLIIEANSSRSRRTGATRSPGKSSGATASNTVLDIISKSQGGIKFSDVQVKTGFDE
ncbi:MAG: hypothetical protein P8X55_03015, partial [Desulfosarcinaceae bacterium]